MCRLRPSTRRDAGLGLVALLVIAAGLLRAQARAEDRTLILAVEVNGQAADTLVEAADHDGAIRLHPKDARSLGLRLADGDAPVALDALPGVRYRVDERRQVLVIQAEDPALRAQRLQPQVGAAPPVTPAGFGAVMDYNLLATGGRASTASGVFDTRAYSPYGTVSSGWLAGAGTGSAGGLNRVVRLDTTLTETDAEGMRRARFGDVIAGGLSWTRPVRMGGGQFASDFGVRPDLVTFPLPELGGRAGVPSTVDVLVNGVRQLSQSVQPGPFELRQLPVVTGAGDVSVVVRDALGRESVRSLAFYASPALLRPGLASYSVEGGLVRSGYGLRSDQYADPALVGTMRYGLTDWVTAEFHAELAGRVRLAGAGAALDLFELGILSLSAASSGGGLQWGIGFERNGRWLSLQASVLRAEGGYRDLAAVQTGFGGGDPVPRSTVRLGAGLSLGEWGGLHAAYVAVDGGLVTRSVPIVAGGLAAPVIGRARVLSVTYSRPLTERATFYATGYRDFAARGAYGAELGVSVAIGARSSADLSGGLSGGRLGGGLNAAQAALVPGDWGWRVNATEGANPQHFAEGSHIAPWGTLTAGAEQLGGGAEARAGAQGSLVLAGGRVFAANRVDDSFAVVETPGLSGVTVLRENRPVGRTDADGQLLVPDLRGWEANRLRLDPAGLPADVEAGALEQAVRPADHTGIAVRFGLRRGDGALVRLVDRAGAPLPVGSVVAVARTGRQVPVGHDGEAWLTGLAGDEELAVTTRAGRCRARLHFEPVPGDIPVIGPLRCEPVS